MRIAKVHPLDGVREKLKRVDQSINSLDDEISSFLAPFPFFDFPVIAHGVSPHFSDKQREAWKAFGLEFLKAERENPVPLRFSVLVGEIIHHLRSCFDHLVWQLSDETCRNTGKNGNAIEFPIFDSDPSTDKDELKRYGRKMKCILHHPRALALIERLQPYTSSNPHNNLLWRIHDMDRTDKHRELTLVICSAGARLEGSGFRRTVTVYKAGVPIGEVPLPGIVDLKVNTRVCAYVVFEQPVNGELEPVIPLLSNSIFLW